MDIKFYIENLNWQEVDQLAIYKKDIYKRSREVELGATENNIDQLAVRTGFEPGTDGFQIRRSNYFATLPPRTALLHVCATTGGRLYYNLRKLTGLPFSCTQYSCGCV